MRRRSRPSARRTVDAPAPAAAGAPARPSAVRAAERRAHLLEQEVTLAYLRELAGPAAVPGRRAA
jgi:hypothetical protein